MEKWMEKFPEKKQFQDRFQNKSVRLLAFFIILLSTNELWFFIAKFTYLVFIHEFNLSFLSFLNLEHFKQNEILKKALPFTFDNDSFWLEILYTGIQYGSVLWAYVFYTIFIKWERHRIHYPEWYQYTHYSEHKKPEAIRNNDCFKHKKGVVLENGEVKVHLDVHWREFYENKKEIKHIKRIFL